MKISKSDNNRLIIYFFFDRDGIADRYVLYMLQELKKNSRDIFVVSNGPIQQESKEKISQYAFDIFERENKGFDVWAYKEAQEHLGWERLASYDEVVLMNYTIMGPVYPLNEMFDEMADRDLDFWGPTMSHRVDENPGDMNPFGYIPDHIQSHFIAVRRSLLMDKLYRDYWKDMPMINGYFDSVGRHETYFTKYFSDNGFNWEVYSDSEDYRCYTDQPIIMMATEMIRDKKCPFFKRRSFMHDYLTVMNDSIGQYGVKLYHYLDEHTDYDMSMLWDNLLRTENQMDIKRNLQLNFVLPSNVVVNKENKENHPRVALIMHIYFPDFVDECADYASSMPEYADIYITTGNQENKELILKRFADVKCNKLDVRAVMNRGRDVAPFLVEFQDYIKDYDYICHAHDKKVGQLRPGTVGRSFSDHCFENVLKSREFVANVIDMFESNPRMGIMMPPPPYHGDYFITFGLEWGLNFKNTKDLAESLGIHVPMSEKKEPVSPLGSVFWARTDALKKVFSHKWTYDEMPEEPVADDGTLLHAIERVYSFSAQAMGYYPGWLFCDDGAAIDITNYHYMLRNMNKTLMDADGIAGKYASVLGQMSSDINQNRFKENYASAVNGKLYYSKNYYEFSERESIVYEAPFTDERNYVFEYTDMEKIGDIRYLRFDLGEEGFVTLKNIRIREEYLDGTSREYGLRSCASNGRVKHGHIFFQNGDPYLFLPKIKKNGIHKMIITAEICKGFSNDVMDPFLHGFKRKTQSIFKILNK